MQDIPVDELLNKTGSTYKLVVLASTRAIELSEGAAPLVKPKQEEKSINIALREILEGKISYKVNPSAHPRPAPSYS